MDLATHCQELIMESCNTLHLPNQATGCRVVWISSRCFQRVMVIESCQLGRLSLVSLAKAGMVEMVGDIALSAAMEWISHLFVLYMK